MNSIYDKYNLWGVKDWNFFQAAIRLKGKVNIPRGEGYQITGVKKKTNLPSSTSTFS